MQHDLEVPIQQLTVETTLRPNAGLKKFIFLILFKSFYVRCICYDRSIRARQEGLQGGEG